MNTYIFTEADFFLSSFILGILLMCFYDLIRMFRRIIAHKKLFMAAEDIIYWSIAGIIVFLLIFEKNSGILRVYEGLSLVTGMLLHINIVGDFFVDFVGKCSDKIKSAVRHATNVCMSPFKKAALKIKQKNIIIQEKKEKQRAAHKAEKEQKKEAERKRKEEKKEKTEHKRREEQKEKTERKRRKKNRKQDKENKT